MIILYLKSMRLFVGSRFLVSHRRLRKPRHIYDLSPLGTMSDHNWRVFHPRGDLSLIANNTRHIFSVSCNRATLLDVVPFTEPTKSNTKHSVDLPTMHSHPWNAMFPVYMQCKMSLHVISCCMYNEHYIEQFITRTLCQVPWIIISKAYNLHQFMLIYITLIYQHIYNHIQYIIKFPAITHKNSPHKLVIPSHKSGHTRPWK